MNVPHDLQSQVATVEEALVNVRKAIKLLLET
jgi:hypothetical protein